MTTITTRSGKGSPLSWSEVDANFTNLSDDIGSNYTTLNTNKLDVTTAASTYETQSHASSTYAPITTTVTKDSGTGAVNTTNGTTAERPTNGVAKIRYNSTLDAYEGYTTFYGWDGLHNGPTLKLGRHATPENNLIITSGTSGDPCVITDGAGGAIATLRKNINQFAGNVQVSGLDTNIYPRFAVYTLSIGTGTEYEITGIPSWVTKITILYRNISSNNTGNVYVQVANNGTYITTGYECTAAQISASTPSSSVVTAGFNVMLSATATSVYSGRCVLERMASSGDAWVANIMTGFSSSPNVAWSSGSVDVGVLDKVRLKLTTGNFDGGYVSFWYE